MQLICLLNVENEIKRRDSHVSTSKDTMDQLQASKEMQLLSNREEGIGGILDYVPISEDNIMKEEVSLEVENGVGKNKIGEPKGKWKRQARGKTGSIQNSGSGLGIGKRAGLSLFGEGEN